MIFQLNGNDYTDFLQLKSNTYKIAQNDIGESWTDANYKKHFNEILKVQGSFDIAFVKNADYVQFLSDISAAKNADGYVVCTLHVLNLNMLKTIECFMKITPKKYYPIDSNTAVHIYTVEIDEA